MSVFHCQTGIDENTEGCIVGFLKDSFVFFITICLCIWSPQSAFKAAKQNFFYMYLISVEARELHAQHKPHSLMCTASKMHWWSMVEGGREREREGRRERE